MSICISLFTNGETEARGRITNGETEARGSIQI